MLDDKQLVRQELILKLEALPDEQLPEVVHFLEYLGKKHGEQSLQKNSLDFAGVWADMDEPELSSMLEDTYQRRSQAFSNRPER